MALPPSTMDRRGEQEQALVGGSASARVLSFPPPSLSFLCVLTFIEAIGLYGLIVALVISA
jgi:F0F1-type ATP synthase membrane subunit c/vacuolar-type H+-ATPase subunit K